MSVSVASAASVYAKYKPLIDRYKGGMPGGFVAAIVQHESGGRTDAQGDPSLGEWGLLQVGTYTPEQFGWPADTRYDVANNVWLGCLDVAVRGLRAYLAVPDLIVPGTADFWKCARLSAAVGAAGFRNLVAAARPGGYLKRGNVFAGIKAWAAASGGIQLSSGQPASKVVARINTVEETWVVGQAIDGKFGGPVLTKAPGGRAYSLPKGFTASMFTSPARLGVIVVATAVVGTAVGAAYLIATR